MASYNKTLLRRLLLVVILGTCSLIGMIYYLAARGNLQHYSKDLPWNSTNTKSNMNDAPDLKKDTGKWMESKIINVPQHESFHYSTKSVKKKLNHTEEPWSEFPYPLDVDMVELVRKLKSNIPVEHKPLFPYRHTFTYHRIDKCVDGSPLFIFLIKSAVNHVENRAAIRETWSHSTLMRKYNSVRLFLIGTPDKQLQLSPVEEENNLHKDMVMMSFRDNYYNNTLKTIGAIHWTVEHCNRSKFVVFVDDDMLVSTTRLVDFLNNKVTLPTFFGGFMSSHSPVREKKTKWYVSPQDYPHEKYPPMPSAGFMIMTMNFVIDIHFASQYTQKFIYDDCYLGILAYKLHVTPVYIRTVYVGRIATDSKVFNTSMLAAHGYHPSLLKSTWRFLQQIT